jgi:Putative addiction module component
MMDIATLIRDIKARPEAEKRIILDALEDDLTDNGKPFEVPDYHRQLLAERIRERDADPTRGAAWETVRQRLGWDS